MQLPFIGNHAVLLVPKYIVRRQLSLDSQEFYNKQITDFLVAENLRANSSLVRTIKGRGKKPAYQKVFKKDVREVNPASKSFIAQIALEHPELLELYKEIASKHGPLSGFDEDDQSLTTVCRGLIATLRKIPTGKKDADTYHRTMIGALTALFYPSLIQPHKEWEINDGRKRIDIVYINAADTGFFSQRRSDANTRANTVIVECKNYLKDIANQELDQLYGRFDSNRGKFGIITCRDLADRDLVLRRCRDFSRKSQGFIIVLTDADVLRMLALKAELNDNAIEGLLHRKFRELLQ